MNKATGSFEVSVTPLFPQIEGEAGKAAVMALEKRFAGDLVAVGEGQMLTALTPIKGSAGYVAIERVTGTLHGRHGSFALQHSGIMDRGDQQLSIVVVPDSGTGELAEIAGRLTIHVADGKHHYEFIYSLPL